jgi:methylated-DNA-[protein]-cysteine S-methyltransferase
VFTSLVLRAVTQIPFGQVVSYGDIARRIGSGSASRAVGGALGRNPVPIIVPCHRVITWKGLLGGYAHGLFTKRALLQFEGQNLKIIG